MCGPRHAGVAELEHSSWGRLVVRAFASWLVFEHQADGAQLTFQDAALPSQQPKSDHPDLCPETEESGDNWNAAWGRWGLLRHGDQGHCPTGRPSPGRRVKSTFMRTFSGQAFTHVISVPTRTTQGAPAEVWREGARATLSSQALGNQRLAALCHRGPARGSCHGQVVPGWQPQGGCGPILLRL